MTDSGSGSGLEQDMLVIKRDETLQAVSFDKILNRIKNIGILDDWLVFLNLR